MIFIGKPHTAMENSIDVKEERKIPIVDLIYDQSSQLLDLVDQPKFSKEILKDAYRGVKYAIDNKLTRVELFNISNLSLLVIMDKKEYPKVLNKILPYFENLEDYDECIYIKKMLTKKKSWFGR
jgi:hypothetical protein